jgi:hypothetical protein
MQLRIIISYGRMCPGGAAMTDKPRESNSSRAERVALCTLRRTVRDEACCSQAIVCPFGIGRDQARVRALFLAVWEGSETLCRQALQLRGSGGWEVTKTERRLLKAISAAQAEDMRLLDNYLYKIALMPTVRYRLTMAVEALAAALAVHGYWLARPVDGLPLPASALLVARTHGRDLDAARIAWP